MRIPRVFLDEDLKAGQDYSLPRDRAHYVSSVLRLAPGRPLTLFNGRGGEYKATLLTSSKKGVMLRIDEFVAIGRESPLDVELAIGLSRGDRMDMIIQKATELGVARLSPLVTERTEVKLRGERLTKKMHHWRQIIISACEQSQRNRLPDLNEPESLSEFVGRCTRRCRLVLHPGADKLDFAAIGHAEEVTVLVGPEGGLSAEEIEQAKARHFLTWQLGPRILRAETAPVAALAVLQHLWGDC